MVLTLVLGQELWNFLKPLKLDNPIYDCLKQQHRTATAQNFIYATSEEIFNLKYFFMLQQRVKWTFNFCHSSLRMLNVHDFVIVSCCSFWFKKYNFQFAYFQLRERNTNIMHPSFFPSHSLSVGGAAFVRDMWKLFPSENWNRSFFTLENSLFIFRPFQTRSETQRENVNLNVYRIFSS